MRQVATLALMIASLAVLAAPAFAQRPQPQPPPPGTTVTCPQQLRATLDVSPGWVYANPGPFNFVSATFEDGGGPGGLRSLMCGYTGEQGLIGPMSQTCKPTGPGWQRPYANRDYARCVGDAARCAVSC